MNDDKTDSKPVQKNSPALWFWLIAIAGLLWYLMDAMAFFMRVSMTPEKLASLPEQQQVMFSGIPLWVNVVFAFEVFGGLLGCLALLLRRSWALPLFVLSLLGVLAQTAWIWFMTDKVSEMGQAAIVMPLVAIVISILMIVVSKSAKTQGWLR